MGRAEADRWHGAGVAPAQGPGAERAYPGVRGRDVPRGAVQERAEPGTEELLDAVHLDDQPDARLPAPVRLLFCAQDARVPRPGLRCGLRLPDRGEDEL